MYVTVCLLIGSEGRSAPQKAGFQTHGSKHSKPTGVQMSEMDCKNIAWIIAKNHTYIPWICQFVIVFSRNKLLISMLITG